MANEQQFVIFRVGAQSYAMPIATVREIVRVPEITAVPQSPEFIAGVINLRGRIIPVIDLRKRFLQPQESTSKNRILVLSPEASGGGKLLGMLVDSASEVLKIDPAQIESAPKLFGESSETYVTGVAKHQNRLLVLLNAERLLPQIERPDSVPA